MKVSGSFLSDTIKPKEAIAILDQSNVDYIHVDVMDWKFVLNKSFSISDVIKFSNYTKTPFDVHLMVSNPSKYIDSLSVLNVEFITFHYEAVKNPMDIINQIKNNGLRVGISIKPDTNVSDIFSFLTYVDLVLVMSVEPGKSGQKFMDSVIYKLDVLKKEIREKNLKTLVSIDGGINNDSYLKIKDKVDIVVSSSYILSGDGKAKVKLLKS